MIQLLKNDADMSAEINGNAQVPISDRNRDYSALTSPVKFDAKWNISSLAIGDKIELDIDSSLYWLGYVNSIKKNWQRKVYNVGVRSGLTNLEELKIEFDTLKDLLNDTAPFNSVIITGVHTGDTINELNHGLTNDQFVQVQPQSGASLPTELKENLYYYVSVVDVNNFKLSRILGGLDIVSLAGGSGNWEIAKDVDTSKYYNNNAGEENANLEWICQKCFEAAGFTLDTSSVTWDFVTGFTFDKIVMDVPQLWAINQDVAADYTVYDSTKYIIEQGIDRNANKINLLEFINIVLSWQGASIRYSDSLTYKMNRDSGTISASPEYNYDEETVAQQSGITYYKEVYNTSRSTYRTSTEDEISTQDSNRTKFAEKEIDYKTNLIFYKRNGFDQIGAKIDADLVIVNKVLALEKTFKKETFTTDVNTSVFNFRRNLIDLDTGKSDIIQES